MSDIFIFYGDDSRKWAQELQEQLTQKGYSCFDQEDRTTLGETISETIPKCTRECGVCLVALTTACLEDMHYMFGVDMALYSHISGICSMVVIKVESCRVPDALQTTCVLDVQEPDYFDYLLTQIAKGLERSQNRELLAKKGTIGSNEFHSSFLPAHYVSRNSDVQIILSRLFLGGSSSVGIIEGHQPTSDATVKETMQGKTSRDSVGIWGIGGLGKTVLARMVYTEAKMKYLMHTAWVVFGQSPYLVGIFEDLYYQLVGNRCSFGNQEAAQRWLKSWSQTKQVFIVLDDVWNPDHAELFNVLGLRGRYLITTRDQRVLLQINSSIHELGHFQRHDSKRLLLQVANTSEEDIVKNKLVTTVSEILNILNDIPLAIATVGASFRVVETESFQKTIWEDALSDLREGGESVLDKLDKAFDLSFQALSPYLKNLFIHMALFPEDVEISSKVVSLVLFSKADISKVSKEQVSRQVRQGLRQLKERSLLQFSREAEGATYYLIHDHLLRFVKQKARRTEPNGLQVLHCSLLDAYKTHHIDIKDENRNQASSSDEDDDDEEVVEEREEALETGKEMCNFPWWEVHDDGYFYNHIAFHLTRAGLSSVYEGLLLNYQWLKAKITYTSVPGLLADFDVFIKMNKVRKSIKLLHGALLLNADSICQDQNLLGPHLVGCLGEVKNPDIQKLICETKSCFFFSKIPVFVPRRQCLTQPGGVLKKIFCHSFGEAILSATVRQSGVEFLTGSSSEAGSVRLGRMTTGESFCLGDAASCHSSLVTSLALDPHDRFVISASCDSSLKLWPLPDKIGSGIKGKVNTIGHHKEDVYCVAVTKDGLRAVSGSLDQTIKIWNLETFQCTTTLPAGAAVRGVCVAENDSLIIACGANSSVVKWNLQTGNLKKRVKVGTGSMVNGITKSSDESILALACSDKTVRIVQLSTLEEEGKPFEGHVDDVICCCFSLDKRLLFSGDNAGLMIIWCVQSRAVLQEIFAHSAAIRTIMLTPDQKTILTSSTDDCIKLWKNQHMNQTRHLLRGKDPLSIHRDVVTHLAISPSGKLAASASRDKIIGILDVEKSNLIVSLLGHEDCVNTVEFLPLQHSGEHDGLDQSGYKQESTVVSGSKDGKVIVWNWKERSKYILGSHPHSVECLCVSKSGSFVFSGSVDSFILMWDPWKRFLVCKLSCGDRAGIRHLSLMCDGRKLSAGLKGSIIAWNVEPIIKKYQGSKLAEENASEIHQSVNSEMIVSPSDVLLEPEPIPLPVSALPLNEIFIFANLPNNKLAVSRSKMRRENKLAAGHQKGDTITALHVSDDESMIFSGSLNGSVRISWRVVCKVTKALSGPWQGNSKSCAITAVTALCTGRFVIAGCQNGEIWMWDCRNYDATSKDKTTSDSPKPYQIGVLDAAVNNLSNLGENTVVASSESKVNPVIQLWELSSLINCKEDENPLTGPVVPSAHLLKCHSGSILDVLVVDESRLVSSSDDGKLLMWTITRHTGGHVLVECSTVFKAELYSVRCLAVTPCRQIILCGTCQNYIEKWTIEEKECESRLPVKFNLKKLVVLPDNQRFMCMYDDLSIEVRCLKGGDSLTEFRAFQSAFGHFCTLREHTAISDSVYCSVKVWDWNTSRVKCHVGAQLSLANSAALPLSRREPECMSPSIQKHSRRITALDWFGMSHVVTGSYDCHLKLWHLSEESASCICQFVFEHTVTAIRSVTNKSIAVGLSDGNVYFLDVLNIGS
ncbi:apoptotic protease-activating factor 1-like [Asterias amurensis]|uniref:apoptotic protease-activating factor 1-like n=1 Tax=Asterias amurensis TaxID=7602 RepID=UPI003AB45ADD